MHLLSIGCAGLLAVAFAVAAAMKVVDQPGVVGSTRALGVPTRWAPTTARMLPVVEVALAAGLLFGSTARLAGAVALGLLGLFTAVVGWNLQRGNRPACNCFGAATAKPIGSETVVRNLTLMVLAGVVAVGAHPAVIPGVQSLIDQNNRTGSLLAVLVVVVATQAALLALVLGGRHRGPAPASVSQLAPNFKLPDLHRRMVSSSDLLARGRPVLLAFVDPGCSPCHALQPEMAAWMGSLCDALEVVAVTTGSLDRNHDRFELLDHSRVLVQKGDEVASKFGFGGTPSAVVVDPEGTVQSEVALGASEIRALVGATLPVGFVATPSSPPLPGDAAPIFKLMTGSGDEVDLVRHADRPQVVLFVDRDDAANGDDEAALLAVEKRLVRSDFHVIVVTTGHTRSGLGLFHSPVALDPDGLVKAAYGVTEAPAAALVGRGGILASEIALGLAEVSTLATAADATSRVAEKLADTKA